MTEKRVTLEEVLAARTPRGGWTKKELAEWGIDWPPATGWIKRLTGDPAASAPMPGRTPVAMQLARKTRIELEQENVKFRTALEEISHYSNEVFTQKIANDALGEDNGH